MKRFWDKVKKTNSCWEWTGAKHDPVYGYGIFNANGKTVRAHRYVLELEGIDVPSNMYVCHTCDNPSCVNPDHLFIGTQKDNMGDMTEKGRRYSKLQEGDMPRIRDMLRCGAKQQDIADWFGVSNQLISAINLNKHWQHV